MNRAFEPTSIADGQRRIEAHRRAAVTCTKGIGTPRSRRGSRTISAGRKGEVRTVLWLELVMLDQQLRQKRRQNIQRSWTTRTDARTSGFCLTFPRRCSTPSPRRGRTISLPTWISGMTSPRRPRERLAPLLKTFRAPATSAMPARGRRPKTPPWPLASRRSIPTCPRRGPTPTRPVLSTCREHHRARAGKAALAGSGGAMIMQPGSVLGDYVVLELLAQGGMGTRLQSPADQAQPGCRGSVAIKAGALAAGREIPSVPSREAEAVATLDQCQHRSHPRVRRAWRASSITA